MLPRPRQHLIHFHGVLAPGAKLRLLVVPQWPVKSAPVAQTAEGELQRRLRHQGIEPTTAADELPR